MYDAGLRKYEAIRSSMERRLKLVALVGGVLTIAGLWAGTGFWMGVGIGLLLVSALKFLADRRER
jgi:uncharacterized membrane protein YhiD involved in acid resistance